MAMSDSGLVDKRHVLRPQTAHTPQSLTRTHIVRLSHTCSHPPRRACTPSLFLAMPLLEALRKASGARKRAVTTFVLRRYAIGWWANKPVRCCSASQ